MYVINPGEFKHPIKIIELIAGGVDDDNIPIKGSETTILETKAKIVNLSGKEFILADGISSSNSKRFYIRWKNINLTSKNKIVYNNKTYNIIYYEFYSQLFSSYHSFLYSRY